MMRLPAMVRDTSWTHLLARAAVRPLLGTRVRPNHITTLRLLTGLAACGALAWGSRGGMVWGGWLWLLSAFLDRADGELARIGNMRSAAGHRFDTFADSTISALFFAAIGVGLRHSWLGPWAPPLGLLAAAGIAAINYASVRLEQDVVPGTKVLGGAWGFDPDDAYYLMAPLAWLGWLTPIPLAAAIVTPIVGIVLMLRLWRMLRQRTATISGSARPRVKDSDPIVSGPGAG
jgi:phosphatidylglycerophosphate synthase